MGRYPILWEAAARSHFAENAVQAGQGRGVGIAVYPEQSISRRARVPPLLRVQIQARDRPA